MKTRERLKRIRQTKSWTECVALAKDVVPGSELDGMLERVFDYLKSYEQHAIPFKARGSCMKADGTIDLARRASEFMEAVGYDFARATVEGNSDLFRRWAEAIDAWHAHEPSPDMLRLALAEHCVPPSKTFTMREIMTHLRARGLQPDERIVRRHCRELHLRIKGKRGRPKKQDTKAKK